MSTPKAQNAVLKFNFPVEEIRAPGRNDRFSESGCPIPGCGSGVMLAEIQLTNDEYED